MKEDKELLITIRDRYKLMLDADKDNRREALSDMEFINVPGKQWDSYTKKERGDRPCYEFNKVRITSKRIINEMRANRTMGKVRGVEGADKETAEIYEGLIRNIWNMSDGDTVIDYAAEYQVGGGMGAWRLSTDYLSNQSFYQDISIEPIQNPFCLFADPAAKDQLKRDAADWILTDKISKAEYKAQYPRADPVNFEAHEFDDDEDWQTDEEVRIAEYWYKEPTEKTIYQLSDGKVIDSETDEAQAIIASQPEMIKDERTIKTDKIMMCIASGDAILEGPTEWAGSQHPFIQVYGEYIIIDGKVHWHGVGRFAKDAQRSYNVSRTAITETIATAPQAKFWATTGQAKGNTKNWAKAHKENMPFLLYTPDPKAPGAPQRMGSADIPVALIQESQIASDEINMVTGIFAADVGQSNQASSGRQEIARQQQGAIATFNFQDNMSKGIKRTWELLIDLIPKVYDTERELRVLGSDGAEEYKTINTFVQGEDGQPIKINDLNVGRFDTTITTGPNFSTKRQEAAEIYQQLMQGNPQIFGVAGDLIFKSMDLPYSEDIADRLKLMLPPEIQQTMNEEQDVPPEVQMMMSQAEQAMQLVEEQAQTVQEAAQQADISKSEVEKLIANLKTEEARFEAKVAKEMATIAKQDAGLTKKGIELQRDAYMEQGETALQGQQQEFNTELAGQMAQSVQAIQEMAAQFNEYAVNTLAEIEQNEIDKPKIVRIDAVRENGTLSAVPVYDNEVENG